MNTLAWILFAVFVVVLFCGVAWSRHRSRWTPLEDDDICIDRAPIRVQVECRNGAIVELSPYEKFVKATIVDVSNAMVIPEEQVYWED